MENNVLEAGGTDVAVKIVEMKFGKFTAVAVWSLNRDPETP